MKKPRPASKIGSKRRAAGWTMLTLGLTTTGLWIASRWYCARLTTKSSIWLVTGGAVHWSPDRTIDSELSWSLFRIDPSQGWDIWYGFEARHVVVIDEAMTTTGVGLYRQNVVNGYSGLSETSSVTLWPLPLLFCGASVMLLRSGICARQRAMSNACAKCGYPLAGLAKGTACPECGRGAGKT